MILLEQNGTQNKIYLVIQEYVQTMTEFVFKATVKQ